MISLEDCIAFSGLSEDEVAAIGEHEHIPQVAACALADYLLKQPHGGEAIRASSTIFIKRFAQDASGTRRNCSWPFVISLKATLRRVLVWSRRLVEMPTLSLQPSRPLLALSGHLNVYPA